MIYNSEIEKGRRVKYEGNSRPWLRVAKDLRLTGTKSGVGNSLMVEYTSATGSKETEWVGISALTVITNPHQKTIDELLKKKNDPETQVAGLTAAINALEALND